MGSGSRLLLAFASYDRNSSSWRTSPPSGGEASTEYSATWPSSGMTLHGSAFELQLWEHHIVGSACSSWRTCPRRCRYLNSSTQRSSRHLLRTPLVSDAHGAQLVDDRLNRGRQIGLNDQAITYFSLAARQ